MTDTSFNFKTLFLLGSFLTMNAVSPHAFAQTPEEISEPLPSPRASDKACSERTVECKEEEIKKLKNAIRKLRSQLENHEKDINSNHLNLIKSYNDHQIELMRINRLTFTQQQTASNIILILVSFVVLSGIVFSGYQLWQGAQAAGVQPSSEMEFSASRVRVTSSVVGILVLCISLIFLIIYTREVYHIKHIPAYKPAVGRPDQAGL